MKWAALFRSTETATRHPCHPTMPMAPSRPPPLAALLAVALFAICLAKSLACLFRHSVAILAGGIVLLFILKHLHNLTK